MSPGTLLLLGVAALHLSWLAFGWGRESDRLLLANLLYLAPSLVAVFVVGAVGLSHRGRARRGWLLIGAGLAAQVVGNGIWGYLELVAKAEPFPSTADLFYLLFAPLLAAGLLHLLSPLRNRREGLRLGLDLTITVGAVGLFFWRFLLAPPLSWDETPLVTAVSIAYPLLDLLLLSLLSLLLLRERQGERFRATLVLFGLGMVLQVTGNALYNAALASETYVMGQPVDSLWTLSTVLLALAARAYTPPHPSRSLASRAVSAAPYAVGPRTLTAERALSVGTPYLALALGFGLLLTTETDPALRDTLEGRGVFYGAVLVTFAVVLRQLLAFYENWQLTQHLAAHSDDLRVLSETLELRVRERTAELEVLSNRFRHDALHDALTGLPNRAHFKERLRTGAKQGYPFGVLYLDFDGFKEVNDNFGHAVGDALLIAIAARLGSLMRPGDLVARLGGDEFAVLLRDLNGAHDALGVAERLSQAFASPLEAGAHTLTCTASIGVVLNDGASEPGTLDAELDMDDVLRDADIAMYRAKALGKSRYVVFEPTMRETIRARLTLAAELRGAAARGELEVYYQPVLRTLNGSVAGFEALVRWRHPQRGLLAPAEFIRLAEESGRVAEIDRWVLRRACLQLRTWSVLNDRLAVGVNLSSGEFAQADLATFVAGVLTETGLAPHRLKLELTESLLMDATPAVQGTMAALKALGVRLHIDDFGTGYSSLAYLQRFDADVLKVDRSFIMRMLDDEASAELVRTIVSMAHNLGMRVVAEGVENAAQLAQLRALGCEYVQGFFFSPPLPAAAVALFLEHRQAIVA